MQIEIISIGQNMPSWVQDSCLIYQKRLPKNFSLKFTEIPLIKRHKNYNINKIMQQEAIDLQKKIKKNSYCIALDEHGTQFTTEQLATKITKIQQEFSHITFIIGGPDGLDNAIKSQAHQVMALSNLTFAHPIVRVILAEQVYRVWSITQGHPYHRI